MGHGKILEFYESQKAKIALTDLEVRYRGFSPAITGMESSQDKRKLLSEARAAPPLISGTIVNSSVLTVGSST